MCICGCDNCDINAQLGSEPHLKLFTSENVKHPLQIANRDPLIFYRSCWSDIDNGPTNSPWVVLIRAAASLDILQRDEGRVGPGVDAGKAFQGQPSLVFASPV